MTLWNWQLPNWPKFEYDSNAITQKERQFYLGLGNTFAFLKNLASSEYQQFMVEILSLEGETSSKIEGEILDRESLQSSIRQQFGLKTDSRRKTDKETGMAAVLFNVYESYDKPLTHEMIQKWHLDLFRNQTHIEMQGNYRTHIEPMQIVSTNYDSRKVFFEAPPSHQIHDEMTKFIAWFNLKHENEPILGLVSVAHVYFESIHPFEDGNGRIGRLLVEKMLSHAVKKPILIAVSRILEKNKKEYYKNLETCNRSLNADRWVSFFVDAILQAQKESMKLLYFLIEKSKIMTSLAGKINPRQEKVLIRMFAEGPLGFKGGLSAENYIAITKTSRATATRDLNDLVENQALTKTGSLRHTRYHLNIPLDT